MVWFYFYLMFWNFCCSTIFICKLILIVATIIPALVTIEPMNIRLWELRFFLHVSTKITFFMYNFT